jgi:hypothetical protein
MPLLNKTRQLSAIVPAIVDTSASVIVIAAHGRPDYWTELAFREPAQWSRTPQIIKSYSCQGMNEWIKSNLNNRSGRVLRSQHSSTEMRSRPILDDELQ